MNRIRLWACCLTLASGALLGCDSQADIGQECGVGVAACLGDLACTNRPGAAITPVCMETCDPTATRTCEGGAVCLRLSDAAGGVCYLGGSVEVGDDCTLATDCVSGAVCVRLSDADPVGQCFTACTFIEDAGPSPDCAAGQVCSPTTSAESIAGFCQDS